MILIIDNGSQYTHLIKRNCRDFGYAAEIMNNKTSYDEFHTAIKAGLGEEIGRDGKPTNVPPLTHIILSGGPNSVYTDPPNLSSVICTKVLEGSIAVPLLGICYGHQMIAYAGGAKVEKGKSAEYGTSEITIDAADTLFAGIPKKFRAWVSHFDEVKALPNGFVKLAHSDSCGVEAMRHGSLPVFGVQFHPEVWHTEHGEQVLKNFLAVTQ